MSGYICTHGHDHCGQMYAGPECPYCERRVNARQQEIEACSFCQKNKGQMAPRHFASPNCESGKRPHCTCDVCF